MLQDSIEKQKTKNKQKKIQPNDKFQKWIPSFDGFLVKLKPSKYIVCAWSVQYGYCDRTKTKFVFRSICIIVNYYNYEMQPSSLTTYLPVHEIRSNEEKKTCWCAILSARFSQKYTHWNQKFDETFWYYIEIRV